MIQNAVDIARPQISIYLTAKMATAFSSSSLSVLYLLPGAPSRPYMSTSLSTMIKSQRSSTKLNAAGLSEIEPDLNEDPRDRWGLNSVDEDDFVYGKYDGHHTYYEGEEKKGTFWGDIAEAYASVEPPSGFQGLISWLFPPAIVAGMYFEAPVRPNITHCDISYIYASIIRAAAVDDPFYQGEYLYIGAAVFVVVFCIIEMDKPDKPHNFEPQIYNMERGARDKLIADYNSMSIWDFNEKYGDLWDFTEKKNDIMQR